MFRFGRYIKPKGPYEQYRDPLNMVTASRNTIVKASGFGPGVSGGGFSGTETGSSPFGSMNSGGSGMGNNGYNVDRYNPVFDQLEEGTILEDWIPRDGAGLDLLFRRIYLRDPIIGPGVDIISNLPWSSYSLSGITDPGIRKIYEDSLDALQLELLMPEVTKDHLVIGRNIMSAIFNERKGIFSGIVPHDPDFIRVSPVPVFGFDPLCDFKLSPSFRKFLQSTDPRAIDARKTLPPAFLEAARADQGFLPLDPVSTIYLARKASQHDQIGTSLLTRTLYFWAIEKALLNAQMASTRRRSRSFVHLMAGIDNVWEPTPEELDALAGMIIQANEDPVGGVVATRTGVSINEPVGGGSDFYKWSDELDLFAKYKMQAIGISEALLSGDATYNNAEQARSVFVENLATLRFRIVHKMFHQNLFPTLARLHGFVKRSKAEIDHNIRIGTTSSRMPVWAQSYQGHNKLTTRKAMQIPVSELIMPTIEWSKQLKPHQDEKYLEILERLKGNDYPVTLKQWAAAAGLNHETIIQEAEEDKKLRAKIESIEVPASSDNLADESGSPDMEFSDESSPDENTPDSGDDLGMDNAGEEGGNELELPADVIVPEAAPEATPAPEAPAESPVEQSFKKIVGKIKSLKPKDLKDVY